MTTSPDDLAAIFRSLGYFVTWDGRRSTGIKWWEVSTDDGLVVQIDFGVPITELQQDFRDWLAGRPSTSTHGYTISGPDSPELDEFMRAVIGWAP